jgi:hypothetical protein
MKKRFACAALALGTFLLLAGCEGAVGPEGTLGEQGEQGRQGLNLWEGPFSFSINDAEAPEPVTDLAEFSTALKAALEALPEDAGTDPEDPVKLKVGGLALSETEQLYALWGAITRYVDLDLSGCKGSLVAATTINPNFNIAGSPLNPDICQENKTKIVSLILSESVVALENGNASNGVFTLFSSLRAVTIPNLRFIGDYAFSGCAALEAVDFPGLVSIGQYSFQAVPLASVNFPKVVSLGASAFRACSSLSSLECPELKSIGNSAFYKCSGLSSLNIPKVESIGMSAFYDCDNLGELTLGATPPTLGNTIFSGIDARIINFKVPSDSVSNYQDWSTTNNTALGNTTITRTFEGI